MHKLSLLQKKILKLLTINCRYSLSEIASVCNTSPATVQYTIKQLFEKKKVGYPVVIFNGRAFGYKTYYIFLKCANPQLTFEQLYSHSKINVVIQTFGVWDAQLIIHAKDSSDIQDVLDYISSQVNDVLNFEVYEHLEEMKWNYALLEYDVDVKLPLAQKNITRPLAKDNIKVPYTFSQDVPDNLDKNIIKVLLKYPMMSYVNIARTVKSNHETVRYRFKKMIERNWIQGFTVTPSFASFGYFSYIVMLKVTAFDKEKLRKYVQNTKDIWYATQTLGAHNLAMYIGAKSPEEFTKKISSLRNLFGKSLIDIQFLLFKTEEYNEQFPHELLN